MSLGRFVCLHEKSGIALNSSLLERVVRGEASPQGEDPLRRLLGATTLLHGLTRMIALPLLIGALALAPQDFDLAEINRNSREISARLKEGGASTLARMETLRALDVEYADKGMAHQVVELHAMQVAAELGNYVEAHAFGDRSPNIPLAVPEELNEKLEASQPVDAVAGIAALAEDELLVLINEAHHVPQHRAFTIELLHALRKKGFTHFAAETLLATDNGLNDRGYPTQATGTYTSEPVYADLVRIALALGYEVVPYEAVNFPGGRELGQATNLLKRTLEASEDARVVVLAGYDHINEKGGFGGPGTLCMAGHLKEMTGLDPLTIDQTLMTEHSTRAIEHPLYRKRVDEVGLERATIFQSESGEPWSAEPGVRDVTLFHPRSVLQDGRPSWLRMGGLRKAYTLPADFRKSEGAVQVEARLSSESAEAIPVDRIEVRAAQKPPALLLGQGKYVIEVKNAKDELLSSWNIEVP